MNYLSSHYANIKIDKKAIPQDLLNIENKTRSNPLPWKAQFSPQFVEAMIDKYATTNDVIYDPFLGSGTVLLEAGRKNLRAYGAEINTAAVILSRIYQFINIPLDSRVEIVQRTQSLHNPLFLGNDIQTIDDWFRNSLKKFTKDEYSKILIEAHLVLSDYLNTKSPYKKVHDSWNKILTLVEKLPYSKSEIRVFSADARKSPLKSNSVDLVLTSPPYINVYNYHQQYRKSVEVLHNNVLTTAKSEIGANRKHRSNRFLTVTQYCLDIESVFSELIRVCKKSARVIFIVGRESKIKGVPFNNGELVSEVAYRKYDMKLNLRQERVFTNRFGVKIYEDILHFNIPTTKLKNNFSSREIAYQALIQALTRATTSNKNDIQDAINAIDKTVPSPLLNI